MAEINYKDLLHKYMIHVGDCEGIDFVDQIHGFFSREVKFTEEEQDELIRMSSSNDEEFIQLMKDLE